MSNPSNKNLYIYTYPLLTPGLLSPSVSFQSLYCALPLTPSCVLGHSLIIFPVSSASLLVPFPNVLLTPFKTNIMIKKKNLVINFSSPRTLFSSLFSLAHLITAVVFTYHQCADDFSFCVSRALSYFKPSYSTAYWTSPLDHSASHFKVSMFQSALICLTSCFVYI